jgi:predicted ATPase/DNA-binding CsgD family transcriptional regulator
MTSSEMLHDDASAPATQAVDLSRLPTAPRYRNNLPLQLTSFIGRESESSAIKQRLWTTRLLTLTGPGGCGKTRLALRVADDLPDAFVDGVWWIELAALVDPNLIAQTIATAFGLRAEASRPPLEALIDYLRSKQILLILDNCEHLIEACAQLIHSLLQTCPDLYVMATSREVLRIGGEAPYLVPPMATPHPREMPPVDALAHYEAVQLFVDRAAAVLPGFAVTDRNAAAVAQVCYRLDGMPLAIELAAARVKLLPVDQIATRLDDRFRLLTDGSRTALPRHQTLRATIDWSYDLLTEGERRVLRRLSVFVGGWTLEAAEAVCADREQAESAHIAPANVLDLLTQLVDKSLVIAERKQVDETRYRMLETIGQYARDRLLESGEVEQTRTGHLDFFLAFAVKSRPKAHGPEQVIWLKRLDADCDNFRTAMDWAAESGQAQAGLRLGGALQPYWVTRGYFRELRERFERLLARPEAAERTPARALVLGMTGWYAALLDDPEAARTLIEEGLAISRERGPEGKFCLAWSLIFLASVMQGLDKDLARHAIDESILLARELGETVVITSGLNLRGSLAIRQGDYALARTLYGESVSVSRNVGNHWEEASGLGNLGWVLYLLGDYSAARALCEEAQALSLAVGVKMDVAWALWNLGRIAQIQGDYQQAAGCLEGGLTIYREVGFKEGIVWLSGDLGIVLRLLGDRARAAALLNEASLLSQALGHTYLIASCLLGLAGFQPPLRAARLLATAQAAFEASDEILDPVHRAEQERLEKATRAALGEAVFAVAWAAGRATSMEQAMADGLAEIGSSNQTTPPSSAPTALHAARHQYGGLTRREREVAALVAQGKSNREIAKTLVLSEYTVASHVSNILSKLEFSARTQIVSWAIEKGLARLGQE